MNRDLKIVLYTLLGTGIIAGVLWIGVLYNGECTSFNAESVRCVREYEELQTNQAEKAILELNSVR